MFFLIFIILTDLILSIFETSISAFSLDASFTKVADISGKIDYINSLDRDQLKAYYKEVLNNGVLSKKGGGGLGLIDIARRSGSKLEYNIREINEGFSFFTLTVKILKK